MVDPAKLQDYAGTGRCYSYSQEQGPRFPRLSILRMRCHIIRQFLFSTSVVLLCLTVGAWLSSLWLTTLMRIEPRTETNQRGAAYVYVEKGWVEVQLTLGTSYYSHPVDHIWRGTAGHCRLSDRAHWWLGIPFWEPAILFSVWPVVALKRRIAHKRRVGQGLAPQPPTTSMMSSNQATDPKRKGVFHRLLLAGVTAFALAAGSTAAMSYWTTPHFHTTNETAFEDPPIPYISLGGTAMTGSFYVEMQIGAPMGGSFVENPPEWWGSFTDFSEPGTLYWVFDIPGWEPVAILSLWPCLAACRAIFRRLRNRRPGHCRQCGHNTFGLTNGICPECGTPLPAGSCPEQPANT